MKLDLKNKTFGRLFVIRFKKMNRHRQSMWLCRCSCGNRTVVNGSNLKSGHTSSCGCYHLEQRDSPENKHRTHDLSKTLTYRRWGDMHSRCTNIKTNSFKYYGGKGIKVCKRWKSFVLFLKDLGECPSNKHSIERINPNKHYTPSNCKWILLKYQSKNKTTTIYVEEKGIKYCLKDYCLFKKLNYQAVWSRFRRNGRSLKGIFKY